MGFFGIATAFGKWLAESTLLTLRQWGRAIELSAPFITGIYAVLLAWASGGATEIAWALFFAAFVGLLFWAWLVRGLVK